MFCYNEAYILNPCFVFLIVSAIRMGRPKKIKKGLDEFVYEDNRPHQLSLCGMGLAYSDMPCPRLDPISPSAYSPPATFPPLWGSMNYRQVADSEARAWSSPLSGSSGSLSPLSPVSTASFSSSPGDISPKHNLYPAPAPPLPVKDEPMEAWTGCSNGITGSGGYTVANQDSTYQAATTTTLPPMAQIAFETKLMTLTTSEVSAVINSDVVDSLVQLATGLPRKPTVTTASKASEPGMLPLVEDDAIDSLLLALDEFEKGDTPMEGFEDFNQHPKLLSVH